MYFSAASRMTQATETFFCFAMSCSVAYNSGGKLAEARVARGLPVGLRPRLTVMTRPIELDAAFYIMTQHMDRALSLK